jgi:hypothetical protein
MTEFLDIKGGRIAYDVAGEGPLIVLSHGIGDRRQAFRFLVPELVGPDSGSRRRTCAGTASRAWATGRRSPAPTSPATWSR